MIKHSPEIHAEYTDLIVTLCLCAHFNPQNDKALRKCLKFMRRRLKTKHMRAVAQGVIKTTEVTPSEWLATKIREIENVMPFFDFMKIARSRA